MKHKIKKILSLILTIAMVSGLSACAKKDSEQAWTYDKQTAEELLTEFSEIAKIPRQTGSTRAVAKYMIERFEGLGIYAELDASGNVIAEVPASEGLEKKPLTILQANLDMVCSPQPYAGVLSTIAGEDDTGEEAGEYFGTDYDPLTDSIRTLYEDGRLSGIDTSLGAKSGMALALILKYLSSDETHGPLRIVLSSDCYDGYKGSNALDSKWLEDAKYMINLCSGSSTKLYNGSASEVEIVVEDASPEAQMPSLDTCMALRVFGLIGGNAADNIDRGRINAGIMLAEFVQAVLDKGIKLELSSLYGGEGHDTIIQDATAIILFNEEDTDAVWGAISDKYLEIQKKYLDTEKSLEISLTETNMVDEVLDSGQLKEAINYILTADFKKDDKGVVSNLGGLIVSPNLIRYRQILIGSDDAAIEDVKDKLTALADGCKYSFESEKTAEVWKANEKSSLVSMIKSSYKKLTGTEIKLESSSTGLECSCFTKYENLDMASIGADVWDSGTVEEFCNVESAVKVLNLLEGLLPEIK